MFKKTYQNPKPFVLATQGAKWKTFLNLEVVTQYFRGYDTAVKNALGNGECAYP